MLRGYARRRVGSRRTFAVLAGAVRELAPRYGFGRRVGWDPWRGEDGASGRGAAAYLSKAARYLGKSAGDREVAAQTRRMLEALPGVRVVTVSPWLSKRTAVTMRNLRLKRWAWVVSGGEDLNCSQAAGLYAVVRASRKQDQEKIRAALQHFIQSGEPE